MAKGRCSFCGLTLDGAHKSYCKKCFAKWARDNRRQRGEEHRKYIRDYTRQWKKDNPEATFGIRLKNVYGISLAEFNEMREAQSNLCLICSVEMQRGKAKDGLVVDHDHETGKVRGLLCLQCNAMLGLAGDNPSRLIAAAAYLVRNARDASRLLGGD